MLLVRRACQRQALPCPAASSTGAAAPPTSEARWLELPADPLLLLSYSRRQVTTNGFVAPPAPAYLQWVYQSSYLGYGEEQSLILARAS